MDGIKGIIDRFEGEYAVIEREDKEMIDIPRSALPPEARAGDALISIEGMFQIDQSETAKRRMRIEKLSRELWE